MLPKRFKRNQDYKVKTSSGLYVYVRLMKWFWQSEYSYMVSHRKVYSTGYFDAMKQFKTKKELYDYLKEN